MRCTARSSSKDVAVLKVFLYFAFVNNVFLKYTNLLDSVDVWEEGDNLVVYHGKTMTSKILLRGVLETINEVAFTKSEYPVIVSIENRCKKEESQYKMAQMIKDIFQERLYCEPVEETEVLYPSPEQMKNKIFIKGIEHVPSSSSSSSDTESDFEFEFESEKLTKEETESKTQIVSCLDLNPINLFKARHKKLEKRGISPQCSVIEGDFDFDCRDFENVEKLEMRKKLSRKQSKRRCKRLIDPHQINRPESLLMVNLQRYNSEEIVSIEEIFSKCSFSNVSCNLGASKSLLFFCLYI